MNCTICKYEIMKLTCKYYFFPINLQLIFHTSIPTFVVLSEIDPCDSQPCQNSGTCSKVDGSLDYNCECTELFEGKQCENGNLINYSSHKFIGHYFYSFKIIEIIILANCLWYHFIDHY